MELKIRKGNYKDEPRALKGKHFKSHVRLKMDSNGYKEGGRIIQKKSTAACHP